MVEPTRLYAAQLSARYLEIVKKVEPYAFPNESGLERVLTYAEMEAAREGRLRLVEDARPVG